MATQSFSKIRCIQRQTRDNGTAIASHQPGAMQTEEGALICAGLSGQHLPQALQQLAVLVQAEEVTAEVIAKGTVIFEGLCLIVSVIPCCAMASYATRSAGRSM